MRQSKIEERKEESMMNEKEGSSIALKCVQLTDSNYTTWAVLMETILKAYGLWETINPKEGSSATDEKKMHTTKAMIFHTSQDTNELHTNFIETKDFQLFNTSLINPLYRRQTIPVCKEPASHHSP